MSEQRQRVEAEAWELYPDGQADEAVRINELRAAFIAGRTVNAAQVEAVANILAEMNGEPTPGRFERTMARAALTAAGLLIEGDDHE